MEFQVAAFYRFVPLSGLPALKTRLETLCRAQAIRGTILIAQEGINGTVAGAPASVAALLDALDEEAGIRRGEVKLSSADRAPFARLKVRIRPEIITMRAPEADPSRRVGTYVEPADWNALIAAPGTLLLDTRNRYETRVGTFEGAVDPQIDAFTAFKRYAQEHLDPARDETIAMFCTGGIRCEKASAYLLARGFRNVFHLKGGILAYLEQVPAEESRWQGDCYVFDGRVAVGHGVAPAQWGACHGCGAPLSTDDRASAEYEPGVSCPQCRAQLTPAKAASLRMRHRQITGG
ncbi:rhodanese-related sulfurtransferase [Aurantimonas sp. Leaf443]|uniref:oxygen-dependent tRNA uridine(34) hydroxylase TrhO n=1 Tax=Aurantimonas sp. Leaf443 TaxID=1736378 RepID=UPI0006FA17F8|nr:rhodanese-related sulfurtransferase [Aurantimonas sp. Leaf443]KQT85726.1 hypothetical protein ASG48_03630 [Aurantimonas sp. Leaf443]